MNYFFAGFIGVACFSGPITKLLIRTDLAPEEFPLFRRALFGLAGFLMCGFALFPFFLAVSWGESIREFSSELISGGMKGVVMMMCWLIVFCQYFYRVGVRTGRAAS